MNIKFFVTTACALTVAVSSGCAGPLTYSAPAASEPPETTITIGLSFDDAWSALIELLTVSFADIELLDRDSGFIRIDFAGNAYSYANCGTIQNAPQPLGDEGWGGQKFSGSYATWLEESRGFNARINIRARPIDAEQTEVQVHARYALGSHVFETGRSSTVKVLVKYATETRTCRPTYAAESAILARLRHRAHTGNQGALTE
jgi:hypothetical protein